MPTVLTSRSAIALLRVTITAALVAVLVSRLPRDSFSQWSDGWTTASWAWMFAAVAASVAASAMGAVRWSRVANAIGVPSTFRQLAPHHFAGQLLSSVLPSTIGGDALRTHRLARSSGDGARSFTSVVLDRLSGWAVLPVVSLLAFALNPGLLRLGAATVWAAIVSIGALAVLALLLLAVGPPSGAPLRGRLQRWGSTLRSSLHAVRLRPGSAIEPLVLSVASTLMLVAAGYLAARALGIGLSPTAAMAILPVVLMIQVIPIGIGGLGLREGALVVLLAPLGIAAAQAVVLGLAIHALSATVGLLGVPALALPAARVTA
ncbi:MAG: lysylphosphatidylglycerol synthase transmembrane domain-containing protein [Actinomycetota bacterium]